MIVEEEKCNGKYEKVPIEERNYKDDEQEEIPKYGYGVRHVQALTYFICITVIFIARGHMGVSIVAMVDPAVYLNDTANVTEVIISGNDNSTESNNLTTYMPDLEINKLNSNDSIVQIPNPTTNELLTNMSYDNKSIETNLQYINESKVDTHENNSNVIYKVTKGLDEKLSGASNIYRRYMWPKYIQEYILGSFFVGYFIMMFPMGLICNRYGGKLPLQICLFVNGIVSLLSPWTIAWGGWKAASACRILQGLSQTGTYPGTISLLAAWIPISERGSLSSYVFTGCTVGTVVGFQVGGFLAGSSWGWPSMFWFTGVSCLLGFAILTVFGSNTPLDHKLISGEEKHFIAGHSTGVTVTKRSIPWMEIFKCKHVWATFASHIGSLLTFYFLLTQVSSYLHYILKFDVRNSGILSSLPYIASIFSSLLMGYLSDYCCNKNLITVKHSRMLYNSIAAIGMCGCLALVSFIQSPMLAVACLVFAMSAFAGVHAGWMVNYMDISPNFSGTMMAIGNVMMNIFTILMPFVVSTIVTEVTNPYQWRVVLLLVAGIGLVANAIFVTFITTDVQPWNDTQDHLAGDGIIHVEAQLSADEAVKSSGAATDAEKKKKQKTRKLKRTMY